MSSLLNNLLAKRDAKAIRDPRLLMLRNQRGALAINMLNGALCALLLMKSNATPWIMPAWLGVLFFVNLVRLITGTLAWTAQEPAKNNDLPVVLTGACGLTWAALPFLIQPAIDPLSPAIVAFFIAGMTAGAAISNASDPKSTIVFVVPPIVSMVLFFLTLPDFRDKSMALCLVLYCIALISWSKRIKQTLDEANRHSKESREALKFIAEQTKAMRERMTLRDGTTPTPADALVPAPTGTRRAF